MNCAQHTGESADLHPVTQRRVPGARGVVTDTAGAQCYAAKHVAIVTNGRRFTNDGAHAVIDDEARTNAAAEMDLRPRKHFSAPGDHGGQALTAGAVGRGAIVVDPMGQPIMQNRRIRGVGFCNEDQVAAGSRIFHGKCL
ncbi:hypothetical protein D9M71_385650 [compost metagenome]